MTLRTAKQLAKITRPELGSWLDLTVQRGFELSVERRRLLTLDPDNLYLEMVDLIDTQVEHDAEDYGDSIETTQQEFDDARIAAAISELLDEASALSLDRDNETIDVPWRDLSRFALVLLSASEEISDTDDFMFWWPQNSAQQLVQTMSTATAAGDNVSTARAVVERAADAMLTSALALTEDLQPELNALLLQTSAEVRALLTSK